MQHSTRCPALRNRRISQWCVLCLSIHHIQGQRDFNRSCTRPCRQQGNRFLSTCSCSPFSCNFAGVIGVFVRLQQCPRALQEELHVCLLHLGMVQRPPIPHDLTQGCATHGAGFHCFNPTALQHHPQLQSAAVPLPCKITHSCSCIDPGST